jgi:translation initiation factor 5A
MVDEKKFVQAGSLKPGSLVLIDEEVCQVKSTEKSKPGKHGSAKARIVAVNIFTNQKRGLLKGTDVEVEQPIVPKRSAQVVAVIGDTVQIMDIETYETMDAPANPEVTGLSSGDEVEYQKWADSIRINRKK